MHFPTEVEIADVAEWVAIPAETVAGLGSVALASGGLRVSSSEFSESRAFDFAHPKVCPRCLAEKRLLPSAWDLVLCVACPVHGTEMVHRCPGCKNPLSWRRPFVDRCCEEFPLTACLPPSVEPAVVALVELLARRSGAVSPSAPEGGFSRMRDLTVWELSCLIMELDVLARFGARPKARDRLRPLSSKQAMQAVSTAAKLLSDWPAAFHRLLDGAVAVSAAHDKPAGKSTAWQDLKALIRDGDGFEFIRSELRSHQLADPHFLSEARVFSILLAPYGLQGAPSVADGLSIQPRPNDFVSSSSESPAYDSITSRQAAAVLGLRTASGPEQLMAVGLLQGARVASWYSSGGTEMTYSMSSVRSLLDRLERAVSDGAAAGGPRDRLVPLRKLSNPVTAALRASSRTSYGWGWPPRVSTVPRTASIGSCLTRRDTPKPLRRRSRNSLRWDLKKPR